MQQPSSETTTLPFTMHGEAREHEKQYRIARPALDDSLGRISMLDLTNNDCVEADDFRTAHAHIGLR
jgi:hypothetical protein